LSKKHCVGDGATDGCEDFYRLARTVGFAAGVGATRKGLVYEALWKNRFGILRSTVAQRTLQAHPGPGCSLSPTILPLPLENSAKKKT
jgi:hypothetical protein